MKNIDIYIYIQKLSDRETFSGRMMATGHKRMRPVFIFQMKFNFCVSITI